MCHIYSLGIGLLAETVFVVPGRCMFDWPKSAIVPMYRIYRIGIGLLAETVFVVPGRCMFDWPKSAIVLMYRN